MTSCFHNIFSHRETRYFQLAELKQKSVSYAVILGSLGLFFNEVDGYPFECEGEKRVHGRASLISLPLSESSPVVSKPGYSA